MKRPAKNSQGLPLDAAHVVLGRDLGDEDEQPGAEEPDNVIIDLTHSHIWDASTVATLDAITTKYERYRKTVRIVGLNSASAERHQRLAGKLSAGHEGARRQLRRQVVGECGQ